MFGPGWKRQARSSHASAVTSLTLPDQTRPLTAWPTWACGGDARVVKAVPDRAQYPVRVRALRAGKLLYMAVPRLARARLSKSLIPAS